MANDFVAREGNAWLFTSDGAVLTFTSLKLALLCREERHNDIVRFSVTSTTGGRRASFRVAVDYVESNVSEFTAEVAIFGYGREVKVGVKWANVCIFQWTNKTCLFGFCFGIG